MKTENGQKARCKVADLVSRLPAGSRHSPSPVHSQPSIIFKPSNAQMKRKHDETNEKSEDFLRPRSRQRVLATPEQSRGSSQEPAGAHDQQMSIAPPAMLLGSREFIAPQAYATPSEDNPALNAAAPEPSPQLEYTSGVTAYPHLPFEPSTHAIIGSGGAQVVDTTQDVKALEAQSQAVVEKEHDKQITSGQALCSLCVYWKIAYTLWPSQSGLPGWEASSITTATPPPLRAMERP